MQDTFTLFDSSFLSYSAMEIIDFLEIRLVGVRFNDEFGCFHLGESVQYLVVRFDEGKMIEYTKDGEQGGVQVFSLTARLRFEQGKED